MNKEKQTKDLSVKVQPSLFNEFSKTCNNNFKTVSEVIRELMRSYIKEK